MGLLSNKPWVNVYSREVGGTRGSEKLRVLVKLDVRMKKNDVYEYKAYAVELVTGEHFKDLSLDWFIK